ncbi:hypothetical protein TNCV_545851 [Trichonephila clavipes]|nr:hypothetical protein TNCV_545851 [Trichonephila clavipes]
MLQPIVDQNSRFHLEKAEVSYRLKKSIILRDIQLISCITGIGRKKKNTTTNRRRAYSFPAEEKKKSKSPKKICITADTLAYFIAFINELNTSKVNTAQRMGRDIRILPRNY